MTRATPHALIARAALRARAASCALVAIAHAASASMRKQGVVAPIARSPGQGRS